MRVLSTYCLQIDIVSWCFNLRNNNLLWNLVLYLGYYMIISSFTNFLSLSSSRLSFVIQSFVFFWKIWNFMKLVLIALNNTMTRIQLRLCLYWHKLFLVEKYFLTFGWYEKWAIAENGWQLPKTFEKGIYIYIYIYINSILKKLKKIFLVNWKYFSFDHNFRTYQLSKK